MAQIRQTARLALLLALATASFAACGKKGPIIPPEALVPAPIASLAAEQKGGVIYLSWSAPDRDAMGRPLKDLAGFKLYRREVLPPAEDCEECPNAYRLIKSVDLEYLQDVKRYDNLYLYADAEPAAGATYQYKVVSYRRDGTESDASNRVRRKKLFAPPAVRLTARATPTSVVLEWQAPDLPAGDTLAGYSLYRRKAGDIGSLELLTPLPVKETRYEDLRLERGVKYVYTVRGVVAEAGMQVEGGLSNEAEAALAQPE